MKFKKIRRSWLLSNRHYLLPVFILFAAIDGLFAFAGLVAVLAVYLLNIKRARLPLEPGGSDSFSTHVYKEADGVGLKLDLRLPQHSADGQRVPLVIFAHGGGWISGFRNQPKNVSWCRFLASRGFAVASIDYRLAPRVRMKGILEDYSDAVTWLKREAAGFGIDPGRIVLLGLSAGGHLALSWAAARTASARSGMDCGLEGVRGVVAYYSPSDLRDLFSDEDKSIFARLGAGSALGTIPARDEETFLEWSPLHRLTDRMLPVMAVHGRRDEVVPYISSVKMIRRLKDLGVPCRFLVHKTGGHGFETVRKDYRTTLILEETVRFIRKLTSA